jgi:hypothetical protein
MEGSLPHGTYFSRRSFHINKSDHFRHWRSSDENTVTTQYGDSQVSISGLPEEAVLWMWLFCQDLTPQ